MSETQSKISENRSRHSREVERIKANPDLSAEAKRRMTDEANQAALKEHARLVEEQRQEPAQAIEAAERKLLGISYPERASAHEKAIIAMSYRDARDRAERAAGDRENADALAELLERAETSGDEQLAEAIFHVATMRADRRVADAYLAGRPVMQGRWERYVGLRREADSFAGLLSAAMPPSQG
jgi:hypothetical protein